MRNIFQVNFLFFFLFISFHFNLSVSNFVSVFIRYDNKGANKKSKNKKKYIYSCRQKDDGIYQFLFYSPNYNFNDEQRHTVHNVTVSDVRT